LQTAAVLPCTATGYSGIIFCAPSKLFRVCPPMEPPVPRACSGCVLSSSDRGL
jgi:hypothetical protein